MVVATRVRGRYVPATAVAARPSSLLLIAAIVLPVTAISGILGMIVGLTSGYFGGRVDDVLMRLGDIQLAFPFILLAIGIIAVLGPSFPTLIVVVGLSGWVGYARVLRSQVLVLRSREFVDAIQALGWRTAIVVYGAIVAMLTVPVDFAPNITPKKR